MMSDATDHSFQCSLPVEMNFLVGILCQDLGGGFIATPEGPRSPATTFPSPRDSPLSNPYYTAVLSRYSTIKSSPRSIMTNSFSKLPTELLLCILSELPDLKTLYFTVLSSPNVYAVFCSNSQLIFNTIVQRSIPQEAQGPMLAYMRLLRECYLEKSRMRKCTWQQLGAVASAIKNTQSPSEDMPRPVIWHTIAQAVRNHDLAYAILRAKLDYLGTLRFEKLADAHYRYRREERLPRHIPPGEIMEVSTPLQDPSWIEENRVVLVLWLLAATWRISNMCTDIPTDDLSAESLQLQKKVFNSLLCPECSEDLITEIALSVSQGPTLKAPSALDFASDEHDDGFRALHTYFISHPIHTITVNNKSGSAMSACFSRSPPMAPQRSDETWAWHQDSGRLIRGNPISRSIRVMRMRPGPANALEGTSLHQLERLGFGVWDNWRVSCELHIRMPPELPQTPQARRRSYTREGPGYVSRDDMSFRWFKLHQQEVLREQEGWHR